MQINPIFSCGVGSDKLLDLIPKAREIFIKNKENLREEALGFRTSLGEYININPEVSQEDDENTISLKEAILPKAKDYIKSCGYNPEKYTYKINIWLNEQEKGYFQKLHCHYGANVSGCYYVDIPKNSGQIIFINNIFNVNPLGIFDIEEYTNLNSSSWTLNAEEGDIYFWRSDLYHEVPAQNFEGIRRSIAFDVIVDGLK
jgi:uncharacterized protein (TIGR02466 family)